ncbi:MAG TPA: DUF1566 domain-containing protein [Gammaproteobacteria bacterium]|nr:DUF1566 domain-containing protein [Gammaproteobacteria bacterium]
MSYRVIFTNVLSALCLAASSNLVFAGRCPEHADREHVQVLDDDNNGTLTDIDSGLTWMRCSLGQQWKNHTCQGQATPFTWQAAQAAVKKLNRLGGYAGFSDWRLPRLSELASIVDIHCKNPRINLQLFPNTPSAQYWSATNKAKMFDQAYVLDFAHEGVRAKSKDEFSRVRLVRGRN